jgi:hypothetical protein
MSTRPNRGASGGPCGGLMKKESKTPEPNPSSTDRIGLTRVN